MKFYTLDQCFNNGAATVGSCPDKMDPSGFLVGSWIEESSLPELTPEKEDRILGLHPRSGDVRGDIMDGILTLFHDEFIEILKEFGELSLQFFPSVLRDIKTGELEDGYSIVNILTRVKALDRKRSKFVIDPFGLSDDIRIFYIDESATRGQPIFRLDEFPSKIIINEELRNFLVSKMDEGVVTGLSILGTEYHRYDYDVDGEVEEP